MPAATASNISDISVSEINERDLENLNLSASYLPQHTTATLDPIKINSTELESLNEKGGLLSPPPSSQKKQQGDAFYEQEIDRIQHELDCLLSPAAAETSPTVRQRAVQPEALPPSKQAVALLQAEKNRLEKTVIKTELENSQLRQELDQAKRQLKGFQQELASLRLRFEADRSEAADRFAAQHKQNIDFLIEKYARERDEAISQAKQKYKTDFAKLCSKLKAQFAENTAHQAKQDEERQAKSLRQKDAEICALKAEIAEKESFFVHNVASGSGSSKIAKLEQENAKLRKGLESQRQRLLQKIKVKYLGYLQALQSQFALERQQLELRYERTLLRKCELQRQRHRLE